MQKHGVHPYAAAGWVLLFGACVGLINGLLDHAAETPAVPRDAVRDVRLPRTGPTARRAVVGPEIATRGPPRVRRRRSTHSATASSGRTTKGVLLFPAMFVLLLVLAAVLGFFLHRTAYGRYWYAIGHNELAAKYAGVNVDRQRIDRVRRLLDARRARRASCCSSTPTRSRPTAPARGWNCTRSSGRCSAGAVSAAARGRPLGWSSERWCCRYSKPRELPRR